MAKTCTYQIIGQNNTITNKYTNDQCFSNALNLSTKKLVIELKGNYSPDFIKKYINVLNVFFDDLIYNEANNTVTIENKTLLYLKAASMSIRYLWEVDRISVGDVRDNFIVIPKTFINLLETYEVSEILAFQLAHLELKEGYNHNHTVFNKKDLGHISTEEFKEMLLKKRKNSYEQLCTNIYNIINKNRLFTSIVSLEEGIKLLNLKKR
jgi:hypothetical protein